MLAVSCLCAKVEHISLYRLSFIHYADFIVLISNLLAILTQSWLFGQERLGWPVVTQISQWTGSWTWLQRRKTQTDLTELFGHILVPWHHHVPPPAHVTSAGGWQKHFKYPIEIPVDTSSVLPPMLCNVMMTAATIFPGWPKALMPSCS